MPKRSKPPARKAESPEDIEIEPSADARLSHILKRALNTPPPRKPTTKPSKPAAKRG